MSKAESEVMEMAMSFKKLEDELCGKVHTLMNEYIEKGLVPHQCQSVVNHLSYVMVKKWKEQQSGQKVVELQDKIAQMEDALKEAQEKCEEEREALAKTTEAVVT